jgi:hypothetical protein
MASTDTIDGSGFPLAFKVRDGVRAATVAGRAPARDVFRVEARTMTGHQKELVVTEGAAGPAWRMVSDEGANLKGTDLAPFPLAFFNAALQADYLNLDAALQASPAHALMATPLRDTFALYVNGRRCPVTRVAASPGADETDPFKAHRAPPSPLDGAQAPRDLIEWLAPDPAEGPARALPGEGRIPILIRGSSVLADPAGLVASTVIPTSPGARFRIRCDETPGPQHAPSALACAAAGIAFCYMTQFTRYIEYRHHQVRAIRFVQTLPFTFTGDGALRGGAEPVDTHVFLHGDEPDAVMQSLLEVAENTCYLHAALRSRIPSRVVATVNGTPLTPV